MLELDYLPDYLSFLRTIFKININFESINSTIKIKNEKSNLSVNKEISN